jgi:signal transduction histidine kinase
MKIRTRLTLTFISIVTVMLLVVTSSIYFFFDDFRHNDFYRRLRNRAMSAAEILAVNGEDGVSLLRRLEIGNPTNLSDQHILVYNDKFEEIYNSRPADRLLLDSVLLRTITAGKDIQYRTRGRDVIGIFSSSPSGQFYVVAAATDFLGRDALASLFNILVAVLLISIVFVLLSGWIYAGKVLSPITRIISEVENIPGTDLSIRLNEGRQQDEIDKLSHTFNRMLERLSESFLSQKNFISNASHELRTPIAVISAEIETALMQTDKSDKNYEILTSVLNSSKRLSTLSNQLLLLAHATARMPNKNFSATRVDQALWDAKFEIDKTHPGYKIEIDFDISLEEDELSVNGDGSLLKVVFLNLMDNACKYSPHETATVWLGRHAGDLVVVFENEGQVDPTDVEKIFAPFFRGNNVKSIRGNGIGLSLAKEIILLHGGAINVKTDAGKVIFTVRFSRS